MEKTYKKRWDERMPTQTPRPVYSVASRIVVNKSEPKPSRWDFTLSKWLGTRRNAPARDVDCSMKCLTAFWFSGFSFKRRSFCNSSSSEEQEVSTELKTIGLCCFFCLSCSHPCSLKAYSHGLTTVHTIHSPPFPTWPGRAPEGTIHQKRQYKGEPCSSQVF